MNTAENQPGIHAVKNSGERNERPPNFILQSHILCEISEN